MSEIRKLSFIDDSSYLRFLESIDTSLFYASSKYRDFLKFYLHCEDNYIAVFESGEIVGVLPLMLRETSLGYIVNSLPYYGSNGGVVAKTQAAHDLLIQYYLEFVSREDVVVSCLTESPLSREISLKSDFEDYRIGQITTIPNYSQDFDIKLFEIIDSSTRRNIRKAQSSNVSVTIDNSLDAFKVLYEIHTENINSIGGKAKDWRFFENINKFFSPTKDFNLYIARIDGIIVSALLLFYFNKTVEYFTPATVAEFRNSQPISEILRIAFREASMAGFKWWNWGGTWITQDGVYKFKAKWGAQDYRYDYFIKLNNKSLLMKQPTELLELAKGFYTVPFKELRG